MSEKINLTEISDDLYKKQARDKDGLIYGPTKNQLKNFLSKNIKYLNAVFDALLITQYMCYIKPNFNIDENGYEFSFKDKIFLTELLANFTCTNMLELRRGHMDKVSDRFVVWIVEGMYRVFMNNDVPQNILNDIGIVMSNRTEYPIRRRYGAIFVLGYNLEQLAGKAFQPKWMTNLNRNDNCVWLNALEADLKLFIRKWDYIYYNMGEGRQVEVEAIGEQSQLRMTAEDDLRAEIEFALAEKLNAAMDNDHKYNSLKKELYKEISKKTGFDTERHDGYEYMSKRISQRKEEIEQQVFKEYCEGINVPPERDIVEDSDFDNMKSSEEVLKEAIEDYKGSLVAFPKLELPDIDIDKIINKFKMEQSLQKQGE